jgi:hypothetical protein
VLTQSSTTALEPTQCLEELVLPELTEVQPAQIIPGAEIKVIGTGGYLRDTCGGYNESARTFQLYFDNEPISTLDCYVNRCEGRLALPAETLPGSYCLSVEKDKCGLEIQVVSH